MGFGPRWPRRRGVLAGSRAIGSPRPRRSSGRRPSFHHSKDRPPCLAPLDRWMTGSGGCPLAARRNRRRSLKPRLDSLEVRLLLSTGPLLAQTTFELGPLGSGGPPSGAFTPAQIEQGYGFNQISFYGTVGNGSGETIAIVDAYNDPNIESDVSTFDTQFGLPAISLTVVNQTGGTTLPGYRSDGRLGSRGVARRRVAHAMAPAASILLVEANSNSGSDLFTAVQYAAANANVVSMSWGGAEFSGETSYDSEYFDTPGVAFVASSGDSGAPPRIRPPRRMF